MRVLHDKGDKHYRNLTTGFCEMQLKLIVVSVYARIVWIVSKLYFHGKTLVIRPHKAIPHSILPRWIKYPTWTKSPRSF